MTQAERSLHVVNAIREIMSRGKLPQPTTVRAAHTEFVATLAVNPPRPIYLEPNSDDFDARAEHVEKLCAAFQVYITAILQDTAQNIPGGDLDLKYLNNLYSDFKDEAVGGIERAARDAREDEDRRAS